MLLRKQSKISQYSQSAQSPFQNRYKGSKAKKKEPLQIYKKQINETKGNIQASIHQINEHITYSINEKQQKLMKDYQQRLVSAQQELNRLRLITNDEMIKIKIKQRKEELENRKKSLIQTNMFFNQKCQSLKNKLMKLADIKIELAKEALFLEGHNTQKYISQILSNYQNTSLKHDKSLSSINKQKSLDDRLSGHSKSKSKQKNKKKKSQNNNHTQRVNTQQVVDYNNNVQPYSNRSKLPQLNKSSLNKSIPVVNSQYSYSVLNKKKQNTINVNYSLNNFQKQLNHSNLVNDRKIINKSLGLLEISVQKQSVMPEIKQKRSNDIAKKLFSAQKNNQRNNFSQFVIKDRKFSVLQKSQLSRMKSKTKNNINLNQIVKQVQKTPIQQLFQKCVQQYAQIKLNKIKNKKSSNQQTLRSDRQENIFNKMINLQSSANDFDKKSIMDIFFNKEEVKRLIYQLMFSSDRKQKQSPAQVIQNFYHF